MGLKLQRPILVGGVGLSFSLWLLQSWHQTMVLFGEYSLLSLIAVGGGLWLLKRKRPQDSCQKLDIMQLERATVERAIAECETIINQLAQETEHDHAAASLRSQIEQIGGELDRKEIKIAVSGGKSVGKTSLIEVLKRQQIPSVEFHETSPLYVENTALDVATIADAVACDYILFLTNGDLTETEYQTLKQLETQNQRVMLVFNKLDQYTPDEQASILHSLGERSPVHVVAIATSPHAIKVRKHQEDGSVQEWMEQPAPDIQSLTQQLEQVAQIKEQLVWATTMKKVQLFKADAKNWLNRIRGDRAQPVIEQYQWYCAAATFANPVPALDILATAAINAQMVIDLGNIYQQKFSLEQAQNIAATMGSLMLKLGLVELSTKAVSTVLKSNAITFVAGGVVQGVSAAYLTRIAGMALVEYFQQQEVTLTQNQLNTAKLGQILQNVFGRNQQNAFMQNFVKQSVKRLLPSASEREMTAKTV